MRSNHLLPALVFFWLPFAAAGQQSSAPVSEPAAPHPAEVQPQVWPPPQPSAQEPISPAPAQPAPTPAASGQIQLNVVVTDKAGRPISGLQRGDFTLLDNNRPEGIQSFKAYGGSAPSSPAQILLVIDAVNIDYEQVSYARSEIDNFLRSDGGRLRNPVTVLWYTDTGLQGAEGPSTDGNALAVKLDTAEGQLRSLRGSAGEWGAIERYSMSVQMLDRMVRAAVGLPGRKLLIWIGPGWPILVNPNMQMSAHGQQSLFANIVELSTTMREAQMQIYSVTPGMPNSFTYLYESYLKGVKKPYKADLPDLDLKVLAVQSGGQALSPSNDLAGQIEQCVRDAGAYYTISFTPPPADGPNEYHDLKVRVDKSGLAARTNTGYYNQPPGTDVPQP